VRVRANALKQRASKETQQADFIGSAGTNGQLRTPTIFVFDAGENLAKPDL
jgi:hypothetical protein